MVGATGRYAHFVLAELVQRGVAVRAPVRSEQSGEVAQRNGASEAVLGDLNEPESLAAAVAGMDGVFHIGPAFVQDEAAIGVAMVDAAHRAGVRKFVYSGVIPALRHPRVSRTWRIRHRSAITCEIPPSIVRTYRYDFVPHLAMLANRDRCSWWATVTVLVGPLRCLAIIKSASPPRGSSRSKASGRCSRITISLSCSREL
jgi:hypothetical protein